MLFFLRRQGFTLSDEATKYKMTSGGQTDANYGKDWTALNGMMFSTFDEDNDRYEGSNCAQNYPSGKRKLPSKCKTFRYPKKRSNRYLSVEKEPNLG